MFEKKYNKGIFLLPTYILGKDRVKCDIVPHLTFLSPSYCFLSKKQIYCHIPVKQEWKTTVIIKVWTICPNITGMGLYIYLLDTNFNVRLKKNSCVGSVTVNSTFTDIKLTSFYWTKILNQNISSTAIKWLPILMLWDKRETL